MKPLELYLNNIGAYCDPVTVDFTRLERLFLICGPTGAGKTTLFDAMTYALYGAALGTRERLSSQLVSHHAPPGAVPAVRLTFAVGTERWRVERTPPFLRHRQRGDGWMEDPGGVKLERESPEGWTEWVGLTTAIDEQLRRLVGLSARDFSKIVVLPQGEFQRFLEAPSRERQDMLEKLFPVEDYDRLTEIFKTRATALTKERDALERQHQELESAMSVWGKDRSSLVSQWEVSAALVSETSRQWDLVLAARERRRRRQEVLDALAQVQKQHRVLEERRNEIAPLREVLSAAESAQGLDADFRRQKEIHEDGRRLRTQMDAIELELVPWLKRREAMAEWGTPEQDDLNVESARRNWEQAKSELAADQLILASQATLESRRAVAATAGANVLAWAQHLDVEVREAQKELTFWADLAHALADAERALTLEEGQPCPVCGSPDHPRPAQPVGEQSHPVEEVLRRRTASQTRVVGVLNLLERCLAAAAEVHSSQLNPAAGSFSGTAESALRAWTEAQRDWRSAVEHRQGLGSAPERDRSTEVAERERDWVRVRSEAQQRSQERQLVGEALARLENGLSTYKARRDESLAAYQTVKARVELGLSERGWTYEQLQEALRPDTERRRLASMVGQFDEEWARIEGQLRARQADFDSLPTEVDTSTEQERAERETRWDAERTRALADEAKWKHALTEWDRLESQYRALSTRRQQLSSEAEAVIPVAQALDGSNNRNLKFKTWALVQYLQDVTLAANARLQVLSGGRYRLTVQTEGTDARTRWGLDLGILDSQTGQERPVGTLSGGEKFMTSISLALGLADVIQSRAGGIRLEALFIDEGFGSLDDQTLDRAMAVLHELGQNRTVGLISHVSELRTRIRSQVEVVKGPRGSHLTLHGSV